MADSNVLRPMSIDFPGSAVFRVAKNEDPLIGSRISRADSRSLAGNRFDLVDEGTIYCATELVGAFAEVLSPFRKAPKPRMDIDLSMDSGLILPGGVPADWRRTRSIFSIKCVEPLPFLHLEEPETLAFLDQELSLELLALGLTAPQIFLSSGEEIVELPGRLQPGRQGKMIPGENRFSVGFDTRPGLEIGNVGQSLKKRMREWSPGVKLKSLILL